jgi:hypothetical protein
VCPHRQLGVEENSEVAEKHMMATTQYTTAREDWGYFVMLVDFAIAFYRDKDEGERSEREM